MLATLAESIDLLVVLGVMPSVGARAWDPRRGRNQAEFSTWRELLQVLVDRLTKRTRAAWPDGIRLLGRLMLKMYQTIEVALARERIQTDR